jgi:RHS repeat-associated protein
MQSITRRVLLAIVLLIGGVQLAAAERTTTYLHTDGLGSVVAATNQSGAVLWRKTYAPFGEQTDTQPDSERLSYTGKPHDDAIGLTYFGGRYYDPAIGRFASVDPVGFVESNPMSFNRYLYVNNNPYKYVDPDGEFLNFAAKFVLDVGINIAFNYATTGSFGVGAALKESVTGIFNPAKTLAKAGKLIKVMAKVEKKLPPPCKIRCFAAGTTVLTEHGFVAIETLEVGDVVWAYDPDTGESALKPILKTGVNTQDTIWNLTLAKGGETYRHEVTGSHPYFVPDIGWVEVAHLRVGNELLTEGGETAIVTGVFDTGQVQTTYNFEVADINTYYVSAARVLVHNCGVPDFDTARRAAFEKAGMTDPSKVHFSKVDPKTGTVVEFKGEGGAKVGYDGPHKSPGTHHDTQHISWQSAGKRGSDGRRRGNERYSGPQHPSRSDRKDQ